jgi:lipid-A-disaccharide synthase
LLPGSRKREVDLNLPTMLEAATTFGDTYQYLVPVAPTLKRESVAATIAMQPAGARPVLVEDARAALYHARASIVASGTATVEAALLGNPFVVVYRLSRLSYAIARRFVTVPHVAMANLIAGRRVVPELIQDEFTAAGVIAALKPLLADGPERARTIAGLREVRERLQSNSAATSEGSIERTARICVDLLHGAAVALTSNTANAGREPESSTHPASTYQA